MPLNFTTKDIESFWSKVVKGKEPNDCWQWKATKTDGQGVMRFKGKMTPASRVSYAIHYNEFPSAKVMHFCTSQECCNPKHLFLETDKKKLREKQVSRFWLKVERSDDDSCWNWLASRYRNGYGMFRWNGRNQGAHRVAYLLTKGDIPDGLLVCHSCDNPGCCNPNHLWVGTDADNMRDMIQKRRHNKPSGERHFKHKLTDKDVAEIRKRYKTESITQTQLSIEYNVAISCISNIVRLKSRVNTPSSKS